VRRATEVATPATARHELSLLTSPRPPRSKRCPHAKQRRRRRSQNWRQRRQHRRRQSRHRAPDVIDHVAGTYDGMLVYGDCCEPVAGNIYAIGEPGAEADIFTSNTLSDRARPLPHGFGPDLKPGGTLLVAANWMVVVLTDLATGVTIVAAPDHSFEGPGSMTGEPFNALRVSWSPNGHIVVSKFSKLVASSATAGRRITRRRKSSAWPCRSAPTARVRRRRAWCGCSRRWRDWSSVP
jgi:hypothetical protein